MAGVTVTSQEVVAPPGAICFGCNQSFAGNPIAVRYDSDLVPESARSELRGLVFHRGHLLHYARRRGWTALVADLAAAPSPRP